MIEKTKAFLALYIPAAWLLIVALSVTDYALQNARWSQAKRDNLPALAAHAVLNGGGVTVATGSTVFGIIEAVVHGVVDYAHGRGIIGKTLDIAAHLVTRLVLAVAWIRHDRH